MPSKRVMVTRAKTSPTASGSLNLSHRPPPVAVAPGVGEGELFGTTGLPMTSVGTGTGLRADADCVRPEPSMAPADGPLPLPPPATAPALTLPPLAAEAVATRPLAAEGGITVGRIVVAGRGGGALTAALAAAAASTALASTALTTTSSSSSSTPSCRFRSSLVSTNSFMRVFSCSMAACRLFTMSSICAITVLISSSCLSHPFFSSIRSAVLATSSAEAAISTFNLFSKSFTSSHLSLRDAILMLARVAAQP
mmetsp:Transcript_1336/g.3865  ORF Transcript_1336/g.3865 Transcript_1336/m.3865 type:complete len:253 (-) Transcript_1336:805-1563(-)